MMKTVLKTLALTFGGGLALGAGFRLGQESHKSRKDSNLELDPLLGRLKSVENRIIQIETTARVAQSATLHAESPTPAPVVQTLAAFETKLAAQVSEVERLRNQVRTVDQRVNELDSHLPVIVQSTVEVRFHEVETRLQQEFEQAQSRSMEAFVSTLQDKVVDRISTLEFNLAEQSHAIGSLRDASLKTDENLQKMLVGIERLVDQTRTPAPPAVEPPPPAAPTPIVSAPAFSLEHVAPHKSEEVVQPVAVPDSKYFEPVSVENLSAPEPQRLQPVASETASASSESDMAVPASEFITESSFTFDRKIPLLAQVPEIVSPRAPELVRSNGSPYEIEKPAGVPGSEPAAADKAPDEPKADESDESYDWVNKIGLELLAPKAKKRAGWRGPVGVGAAAGLIIVAGLFYSGIPQKYFAGQPTPPQTPNLASTGPGAESTTEAPATDLPTLEKRAAGKPGDLTTLIDLGREYARRKDWAKAEAAYRSALETSPGNRDAAFGLSDVLYQEQKYEESAAVVNKLSAIKAQ
ncbi:MAG: hypothetical protein DMG57_03930 [Acidobacteria bacterium]|nr:MAG: hypothetical protein DMG57_03930 [Acidobacteriota bacterium]